MSARATDDQGAKATSPAVSITVSGSTNNPPAFVLTAPVAGDLFSFDEAITLAAQASDEDGGIRQVDFYDDATLVGSALSPPYQLRWANVPPGDIHLSRRLLTAVARYVCRTPC